MMKHRYAKDIGYFDTHFAGNYVKSTIDFLNTF